MFCEPFFHDVLGGGTILSGRKACHSDLPRKVPTKRGQGHLLLKLAISTSFWDIVNRIFSVCGSQFVFFTPGYAPYFAQAKKSACEKHAGFSCVRIFPQRVDIAASTMSRRIVLMPSFYHVCSNSFFTHFHVTLSPNNRWNQALSIWR